MARISHELRAADGGDDGQKLANRSANVSLASLSVDTIRVRTCAIVRVECMCTNHVKHSVGCVRAFNTFLYIAI